MKVYYYLTICNDTLFTRERCSSMQNQRSYFCNPFFLSIVRGSLGVPFLMCWFVEHCPWIYNYCHQLAIIRLLWNFILCTVSANIGNYLQFIERVNGNLESFQLSLSISSTITVQGMGPNKYLVSDDSQHVCSLS